MRYYLIAGEASGDLHGSNLIRGLKGEDPDAEFRYWGGDMMSAAVAGPEGNGDNQENASAGDEPQAQRPAADMNGPLRGLVRSYKSTAVMGFGDVLSNLGKILGNISFCKRDILGWKPDVVILIDYPGFNMRIARFCHSRGIRVFYYIAPKTWASRESRNRKLKRWVDKLFIVFPFEIPYFTQKGIPFTYAGNPLLDAIDGHDYAPVTAPTPYVALLAGSRKGEISRMMPVCMKVADELGCRVVIAGAPSRSKEDYEPYIGSRPNVELVFGRTYDVLKFSDAAIINSGTASLEAALIGTPQVVCWSTSPFTAFLARKVVRVFDHIKYISLGNLIIDKFAFRELVQEDFTVEKVCAEVRRLRDDEPYRERMLADYAAIREALGGTGASNAVARAMISDLKG